MSENDETVIKDSDELPSGFSTIAQAESYTRRRPRLSINHWINLEDFKNAENAAAINSTYKQKEQVNRLLNETYVNLEKAEEINGCSSRKKRVILEWKNVLEYQFTVNWFFVYELKKKEGWWSWLIIVISTITSTLSLVRPDDSYTKMLAEGFLSFFSVLTTLIAAWIKKQNYVDRIKNLDRYIQKLSKLNIEIESVLTKSPWDRVNYNKFMEMYEPQIVQLVSSPPPMAPEEFKASVWQLTRFYPELIQDTYPWYDKNEKGSYVMTDWGDKILKTYDAVYYSRLSRRVFSCYYCRCKCFGDCCKCRKKDNYITELYKNCDVKSNQGSYENVWPKLPNSESLTRQMETNQMKLKLAENIELAAQKIDGTRDGESIIELAALKAKQKESTTI